MEEPLRAEVATVGAQKKRRKQNIDVAGGEDASSSPKSTGRKRQPRDRKTKEKKPTVANSHSGTTTKAPSNKPKKDPSKDFRLLEMIKLVNVIKPLTVNGNVPKEDITSHLTDVCMKTDSTTYLSLSFPPSDPNFPFELPLLQISLAVPRGYPNNVRVMKELRPYITVLNNDIPREFSLNIEDGFRRIAALAAETNKKQRMIKDESAASSDNEGSSKKNKTNTPEPENPNKIELVNGKGLLSLIQTLDKYLEMFLKEEKRPTISVVRRRVINATTLPEPEVKKEKKTKVAKEKKKNLIEITNVKAPSSELVALRDLLIERLKARLGDNVKLFRLSEKETIFSVVLPVSAKDIKLSMEKQRRIESGQIESNIPEKPLPPYAWCLAKTINIKLSIPHNYPSPDADLKISFLAQTMNKLSINKEDFAFASQEKINEMAAKSQLERNSISIAAKNVVRNFGFKYRSSSQWQDGSVTLTEILNWLVNNLGFCCLGSVEMRQWDELYKELRSVSL